MTLLTLFGGGTAAATALFVERLPAFYESTGLPLGYEVEALFVSRTSTVPEAVGQPSGVVLGIADLVERVAVGFEASSLSLSFADLVVSEPGAFLADGRALTHAEALLVEHLAELYLAEGVEVPYVILPVVASLHGVVDPAHLSPFLPTTATASMKLTPDLNYVVVRLKTWPLEEAL